MVVSIYIYIYIYIYKIFVVGPKTATSRQNSQM